MWGGEGGTATSAPAACTHVLCVVCCVLYTPLLLKITADDSSHCAVCHLLCAVPLCAVPLCAMLPAPPPTPCLPQAAVERWGAARLYTQVAADNEVSGVVGGGSGRERGWSNRRGLTHGDFSFHQVHTSACPTAQHSLFAPDAGMQTTLRFTTRNTASHPCCCLLSPLPPTHPPTHNTR